MGRSRRALNKKELTFGVIQNATMGNATSAIIVVANDSRRELRIANISDTAARLSIGDAALTLLNYTIALAVGGTLTFSEPISTQAIYAICGAAAKQVAYQEAT